MTGCAVVGPDYQAPQAPTTTWQAPQSHGGSAVTLAQWWQQFDDPLLNQLIEQAEADSPTLAAAWARISKARASLSGTEAAGLPAVSGSGSLTRARQQQASPSSTGTTRSAGLDASWEIDLFGKLRRNTEAAQARIEARVDDWHDARISLAAEVADAYVQYRACTLMAQRHEQEVDSMLKTERATAAAVRAGLSAASDGALARADLAATRSSAASQRGQCELLVKSLVNLSGIDEPALRRRLAQETSQRTAQVPQPREIAVQSVPAEVLRQRPDLVALERELAATSAEMGAAQADLYPSLSLSGAISLSASSGAPATAWSFGPSLSIPLFDAGKRRAAVRSAQASHDLALANWHQGVRTVVKEVEQALVNLDSAGQRSEDAARAAQEYDRYAQMIEARWRAGFDSLLTLEQARRSALSAQVSQISLQQNRVQYWIALYKALGGGWQPGTAAEPPAGAAFNAPKGSL